MNPDISNTDLVEGFIEQMVSLSPWLLSLLPSARITRSPVEAMKLGAKTTCKDRWRQVLAEADRINPKHLLTLEAGISPVQTDEMQRSGLALVIPTPIQESYKPAQLGMISSFGEFIGLALTSKSPAT